MSGLKAFQSQGVIAKQINSLLQSNPKRAAEILGNIGLTPPRLPTSNDGSALLSQATASWTHIGQTQTRIRIYTFNPQLIDSIAPQTVILSSSFGNTAASMLRFVPPLLEANFRIVVPDHHAHGDSEGKTFDLRICIATLAELARTYQPLAGIVGMSVGASAAVGMLTSHPDIPCPKVVCIAPSLQTRSVTQDIVRRLGLNPLVIDELYKHVAATNIYMNENLKADIAKSSIISRTKTKALVIHDLEDPIANVDEGKWLASRFENNRFEPTRGLKHFGALRSEYVIGLATTFMIGVEEKVKDLVRESKL